MPQIIAFYHFAPVEDPTALRAALHAVAAPRGICGTVLVAEEGVNGTIAGPKEATSAFLSRLRAVPGFADLAWKTAQAEEMPFARLKVRVKAEIVTMGQPGLTRGGVGRYVAPADWNALISAPDVVTIDTRNQYEIDIGRFAGAIDPQTDRFRDFPAWWQAHADAFAGKRIAMYCTGGIRCEKSTAYLRSQGVEEVYHLKGGILKYLEDIPPQESLWQGACFVFDERVSVEHGLAEGPHELCRACRRPIAPEAMMHPDFELGVQCAACIDEHSAADRARFRERQHQIELAQARGERHIGG
ncbi:MAG: rhodanese-related sulfurtransferase [Pseudomonadota bacterium]